MKVLITGACGFVGSSIIKYALKEKLIWDITAIDNMARTGGEINKTYFRENNIPFFHCDIRNNSDLENLQKTDWIIDCSANASVLAGIDNNTSSRQLMENNLFGTINILEKCKKDNSGLVLLSTSRVYNLKLLSELNVEIINEAFQLQNQNKLQNGIKSTGISETFSTSAPVSLYGATKLASESIALEYSHSFGFPVWINRCGLLAGSGQFGKSDQGIISFWINSFIRNKPLKYIGFEGSGYQVRDCLHPNDLAFLINIQMKCPKNDILPKIYNVSGGAKSAFSLKQLSNWCNNKFGNFKIEKCTLSRPFDLPWIVLDCNLAHEIWGWKPTILINDIFDQISDHALLNPEWLDISK